MLIKDEGLVLKKISLLNADEILVIFLKEGGKLSCKAKGIKKIMSRKAGSLDIVNYIKISLASSKSLDIITEVRLIDYFPGIKDNNSKFFYIYYLAETLNKVIYDGEVSEEIFELSVESLRLLNAFDIDKKTIISYMNISFLKHLGVLPEIQNCFKCQTKFSESDIICVFKSHFAHRDCFESVNIVSIKILKLIKYAKDNTLQQFIKINTGMDLVNKLYCITTSMLEISLDSEIKSKLYIK